MILKARGLGKFFRGRYMPSVRFLLRQFSEIGDHCVYSKIATDLNCKVMLLMGQIDKRGHCGFGWYAIFAFHTEGGAFSNRFALELSIV